MTCFVDLIVDCLAVDDEEDAAACVIARLSIRVVNMERMLSRKDTCSLSFFSARSSSSSSSSKFPLLVVLLAISSQITTRKEWYARRSRARDEDDECVVYV